MSNKRVVKEGNYFYPQYKVKLFFGLIRFWRHYIEDNFYYNGIYSDIESDKVKFNTRFDALVFIKTK